jgi:hypothetical protein
MGRPLGAVEPDPVAVRRAARALLRAAGYEPGAVMWFSCYDNQLRVHVVTANGVEKFVHALEGGNQAWGER